MTDVLTKLIEEEMPRIRAGVDAAAVAALRDIRLSFGKGSFDPGAYLREQITGFAEANGLADLDYFPDGMKEGKSDVLNPPYAVLHFMPQEEPPTNQNVLSIDSEITELGGCLLRYPSKSEGGADRIDFSTSVPIKTYEQLDVTQNRKFLGFTLPGTLLGQRVVKQTRVKEGHALLRASYLQTDGGISGELRVGLSPWKDANYREAASALAALFGYSLLGEAAPARNYA